MDQRNFPINVISWGIRSSVFFQLWRMKRPQMATKCSLLWKIVKASLKFAVSNNDALSCVNNHKTFWNQLSRSPGKPQFIQIFINTSDFFKKMSFLFLESMKATLSSELKGSRSWNKYLLAGHITRSRETYPVVASFNPMLNYVRRCFLCFQSHTTARTASLASLSISSAFPKAPQHYQRHWNYGNWIRKQLPWLIDEEAKDSVKPNHNLRMTEELA